MTDTVLDDTTKLKLEPKEVLKMIKRMRAIGPLSIMFHVDVQMPTSETHYFPAHASVPDMTLKQATRVLESLQRTHDVRVGAGKDAPLLKVHIISSTYDKRKYLSFG